MKKSFVTFLTMDGLHLLLYYHTETISNDKSLYRKNQSFTGIIKKRKQFNKTL